MYASKMKLVAYLHISSVLGSEKNFNLLVNELTDTKTLIKVYLGKIWIPAEFSFSKDPPKLLLDYGFKTHKHSPGILKIEAHVEKKYFPELFAEFKVQIECLAIAANISYPGSLVYDEIYYSLNDSVTETSTGWIGDTIRNATITASQNRWPPLKTISFIKTWKWLSSLDDVIFGFSRSQMGRVINSLKYINNSSNKNDMDTIYSVIWSVMGIEALFLYKLQNDKSKTNELTKRIIFFVGKYESNDLEKKLSEIYNYRSRLLHGDTDFPSPEFELVEFSLSNDKDYNEIRKFTDSCFETSHILTAVLIKSIQKLIDKKMNSLSFDIRYRVSTEN